MMDAIRKPAAGWNAWNVRSVLSHVHMPDGFAVSLGIKVYSTGRCLHEALIGRKGKQDEVVVPGPRSCDGTYTFYHRGGLLGLISVLESEARNER